MIKLIASDMDGTLLSRQDGLPADFFEVMEKLRAKGIHFLAASGRSYATLWQNFEPHPDWVDYICDNGACLVENGEVVQKNLMDRASVQKIIDVCTSLPGIRLVLCGVHGSYHAAKEPAYGDEISKYYVNEQLREDFASIDDDIYKVALLDLNGPEKNVIPALREAFGEELDASLTMLLSGSVWMDVMAAGITKGVGLRYFQQRWGIAPEETMAFGDYFNDAAMFDHAYYSFAMENAHPGLKQYARFIAESNEHNGVLKAIRQYALEE